MDPLESLQHLFNGLALFNDHYRFGGILDYCKEFKAHLFGYDEQINFAQKREFEKDMDREMLLNVNSYVQCVNGIYTNYSNVVDKKYKNRDGKNF
uniref:Uncharacterized protein n=1 Tax=Meloidogyne enterolobii TaxID=390850 RepID=A0A6V7UMS3_MELEN|nr:unnamed protein product [Meloidogyne enterolobii]